MKIRPFELSLVSIFGFMALVSLVLLSIYKGDGESAVEQMNEIKIWGTLPEKQMADLFFEIEKEDEIFSKVSYKYYSPDSFRDRLTNALADGIGPDIVLVSHEELVSIRNRIMPISYDNFSLRDFQDRYLDGAQIFTLSDGVYGYPIGVDPLVMYWNKDLMVNKGFLSAPKTWEELTNSIFPQLIERDFDRTIKRSVVAMGEYGNVRNSFAIISALLIQGGTVGVVDGGGRYEIRLRSSSNGSSDPLLSAINFYTRFSKPDNSLYSWNRSFADDRQKFISEDLVFYFGLGSEANQIKSMNPNLNFDIAEIPQGGSDKVRRTYGKFYGFSLLKSSRSLSDASVVMSKLANVSMVSRLAKKYSLAPAYNSLISQGNNDIYGRVIYYSAPVSYGWLNSERSQIDQHFTTMTKDINENRRTVDDAVADALVRLSKTY